MKKRDYKYFFKSLALIVFVELGLFLAMDDRLQEVIAQTGNQLATIAASTPPGEWQEVPQNATFHNVVGCGDSGGSCDVSFNRVGFGQAGGWDRYRHVLHYTGEDHGESSHYFYWDSTTNNWTDTCVNPTPCGLNSTHVYEHSIVNSVTGTYYLLYYSPGSSYNNTLAWNYYPVGGPFPTLPVLLDGFFGGTTQAGTWITRTTWDGSNSQGVMFNYDASSSGGVAVLLNPYISQISGLTDGGRWSNSFTNRGPITSFNWSGVSTGAGVFTAMTATGGQCSPSPKFTVAYTAPNGTAINNFISSAAIIMADPGAACAVNDVLTIPGTSLGGTSPTNDATITVTASIHGYVGFTTNEQVAGVYQHFAIYDEMIDAVILGGGSFGTADPSFNNHLMVRLDHTGTATKLVDSPNPDVPLNTLRNGVGTDQNNVVVGPNSGDVYIYGCGHMWDYNPRGTGSYTEITNSAINSHLSNQRLVDFMGDGNKECTFGGPNITSNPVPEYGGVTYVYCFPGPSGTCHVVFYRDKAYETFAQRCSDTGIVRCIGFDQASDVNIGTDGAGANTGITRSPAITDWSVFSLDTTNKVDGASSLKMVIPNPAPSTIGDFFANFSSDLSVNFGANSDFYVQWLQYFDTNYISNVWNGEGPKQAIIAVGDVTPGIGQGSCTENEIVVDVPSEAPAAKFPILYNACDGSSSHGKAFPAYRTIISPYANPDTGVEDARPGPTFCTYNGIFQPNTCKYLLANTWMSFQVHIHVGPLGSLGIVGNSPNDEYVNSYLELWVGVVGQPSELTISNGPFNISAREVNLGEVNPETYGKVWLTVYDTNRCMYTTNPPCNPPYTGAPMPPATTWYDSLVISTNKIADPAGSSGPLPPTKKIIIWKKRPMEAGLWLGMALLMIVVRIRRRRQAYV